MEQKPDIRWRQRFQSFGKGLIANGDEWMAMIAARNRSSHTYNEKTAHEVVAATLGSFVPEFSTFLAKFSELDKQEP